MIIQPKTRGFICTTAHPAGCRQAVKEQVEYVERAGQLSGPKNVLVIGSSTGYGLASRIVPTFAAGAKTIGVFFEKEADERRTASPGWYNTAAFEELAHAKGYYAKSINGDAFSNEIKQKTAEMIRKDLGQVDLVIYSLATPRRKLPDTGEVVSSVLKPIGSTFTSKTVDPFKKEVKEVTLEPASAEEVADTVTVMGGDDWRLWIEFLAEQGLLANDVKTVAYSYIGPELTHSIYRDGSIGQAKAHLKHTADQLKQTLKSLNGDALVSVDKAIVTQASAAIPVVPLYISILFKLMKAEGTHEGSIEQIYRLYRDYLCAAEPKPLDSEGYIRIDDLEMAPELQKQIQELWPQVTSENINELTDIDGYCDDFYRLFGFNFDEVDYSLDVDPVVPIPSLTD